MQQKKYKSKFEFSEEELENQKKEALRELVNINNEMRKERKKKIIIISCAIIFAFILFKIIIGQIDINSPNVINQHKNRLYQVSLNGEKITVGVEEVESKTIVPFMVYLKHYSSHSFFGKDSLNYSLGDKLTIDIKSFECYTKDEFQLSCVSDNGNLIKKEKNDLDYHLNIKKATKGEKVFYDGKFVENIGDYLNEPGIYHVSIVANYSHVKSTIYFNLKIE